MKWISSTRNFRNAIEKLYFKIHGQKVTVTEVQVQQKEPSKGQVDDLSSSNPASSLKGLVDVPAYPKKDDLALWRKRHERRTFRDQDASNKPLGTIRAVQKMPHGHQAKWFRKSVKAGIKPEESEEEA